MQQSRQSGSMGRRQKNSVSPLLHMRWYFSLFLFSPCRASYLPSTSFSPGVRTLLHCAMAALAAATPSLWPSFHSAAQVSSCPISVSVALVSKTLTMQLSKNSCRPMESWRQSWRILTMAGSTITLRSTFLASQKASNSPSSFMNQMSKRKVLRPLLSCTISTKPPRRSRPSRSTPSTPLARMCGAHLASVSKLQISQLSPSASGSALSSEATHSSSSAQGFWKAQAQGEGCSDSKKGAAALLKMSSCLGKKRNALRAARKGRAWFSRLPLLLFSVFARCWNTSLHSTMRWGNCSARNCSPAATTSSTVHSSRILDFCRPRNSSMNSRRLSLASLSTVLIGGTSSGIFIVYSAFLNTPSSISAFSSVIFRQAVRYAAMMSSLCARFTSTFCLPGFGGITLVDRKNRLTGQLSHRQLAILLNLIGAIKILLKPTLVNSLTKNSSVKGVSGCLISSNCMNSSSNC